MTPKKQLELAKVALPCSFCVTSQFLALGYGIINYSTRHARCPVFAPKKIYIRNSEFYSFSASPIASLDYLTTNRPTTAFMTHSAPAPVHMTPSYDAVISSRSADSQTSNYAATTPRTAVPQAIPPK